MEKGFKKGNDLTEKEGSNNRRYDCDTSLCPSTFRRFISKILSLVHTCVGPTNLSTVFDPIQRLCFDPLGVTPEFGSLLRS